MTDTLTLSKDAQDLLFHSARTANTFTDEPVTQEQLRAIYDLVKFGPTAMNNQPLRVTAVRSPEARETFERLRDLLAIDREAGAGQRGGPEWAEVEAPPGSREAAAVGAVGAAVALLGTAAVRRQL